VLALRVLRDPEADVEARGIGKAPDRGREHRDRVRVRAQVEQVVAPVEQVILGRLEARGALVVARRRDMIADRLVDVAEQVVERARLLDRQHPPRLVARRVDPPGLEVRHREVVAVRQVRRVEIARALEVRDGIRHAPRLEIELGERVVGREAVGGDAGRLEKLAFERGRFRSRRRLRERRAGAGQPERERRDEGGQVREHGAGAANARPDRTTRSRT